MKTGWPPGLLQDDDRKLSKWFATRLGSRYQLRKNIMTQQSEAQRLADALGRAIQQTDDYDDVIHVARWFVQDAAAELRRLEAVHDWQYKMAGDQLRRIEKLERTNAQLLEALEDLERTAGQPATLDDPVRVKARAAIAAAKGEA